MYKVILLLTLILLYGCATKDITQEELNEDQIEFEWVYEEIYEV